MTKLTPVHPGETLLQDFILPMLAAQMGVDDEALEAVISGHASIDRDMAQALGKHFKMTAQFWMNLQADYDRRKE